MFLKYSDCLILISDFESNNRGGHYYYTHNNVSTKGYPSTLNNLELQHNDILQKDNHAESKSDNSRANVKNVFPQTKTAGSEINIAVEKLEQKLATGKEDSIDKDNTHTVNVHTVGETAKSNQTTSDKGKHDLTQVFTGNRSDFKDIHKEPNKIPQNVNNAPDNQENDTELIAFSEESLQVFETSGLSREENKIIEALEDTISGYVNAAFEDGNDKANESKGVRNEGNSQDEVFDSRLSSLSDESASDKPGIIVQRQDTYGKRDKRPNSVSFQLPENHVDKQTNGQFNTRTLPAGGRAQGYKRILNFYSYRPNQSVWSTKDFMRHYSDDHLPAIPMPVKSRGSVSKKSSGPFNASFKEFLRGITKSEEKLQPIQKRNSIVRNDSDTAVNLPTNTRKRASILDRETAKLIPGLKMTDVYEDSYKLSDQPYIVEEIKEENEETSDRGDKFLY